MFVDLVELQQCIDRDTAIHVVGILKRAEIPYSISGGNPAFNVSSLGSAGGSENMRIIISISRDRFEDARAVMEEESLKQDLPADYHLHDSRVEELKEIVSREREWSAFDVAHAKRLLREKGIEIPDPDQVTAKRLADLREGKPASSKLLFAGWLFSLTGGFLGLFGIFSLIGIGIGWSLCSMKEKTPEGEFLTFNRASQESGKRMMTIGILAWILAIIWWRSKF